MNYKPNGYGPVQNGHPCNPSPLEIAERIRAIREKKALDRLLADLNAEPGPKLYILNDTAGGMVAVIEQDTGRPVARFNTHSLTHAEAIEYARRLVRA